MNKTGLIYFIQPTILIGTNKYKIGMSMNTDLKRFKGYHKGTRYILIQECYEPNIIESELKLRFSEKFKVCGGKEYFEGKEEEMYKEFSELTYKHYLKNNVKKDERIDEKNNIKKDDNKDDNIDDKIDEKIKDIFLNYKEDIYFGGNKKLIKFNILYDNIGKIYNFQYINKYIDYKNNNCYKIEEINFYMNYKPTIKYHQILFDKKIMISDTIYDLNDETLIKKLYKEKKKYKVYFDMNTKIDNNNFTKIYNIIKKYPIKRLIKALFLSSAIFNGKYFGNIENDDNNYIGCTIMQDYVEMQYIDSNLIVNKYYINFNAFKIGKKMICDKYLREYIPYNICSGFFENRDYKKLEFDNRKNDYSLTKNSEKVNEDFFKRGFLFNDGCVPWRNKKYIKEYISRFNKLEYNSLLNDNTEFLLNEFRKIS